MAARKKAAPALGKIATGFEGFDAVTGGGLPAGRVTVVAGSAGAGCSWPAAIAIRARRDRIS